MLPLTGCWLFLTAPVLDSFPPGTRAAVVLFDVASEATGYEAPTWGPASRLPPPAWASSASSPAAPHPAAVYEAFRRGLGESGHAVLVENGRSPVDANGAPRVQRRWGDPSPRPFALIKPTDFYSFHLAPVSPSMPALARELGVQGLVEVFLRPVVAVYPQGGPGLGYQVKPMRVRAEVTVFGADGRRRYENIFRSEPIPLAGPAGPLDPGRLQEGLEEFARKLGSRVAVEAFSG
ncbi:MAG: hypothetical protein ACYDCL_01425 [Myxococcales bacterium]